MPDSDLPKSLLGLSGPLHSSTTLAQTNVAAAVESMALGGKDPGSTSEEHSSYIMKHLLFWYLYYYICKIKNFMISGYQMV